MLRTTIKRIEIEYIMSKALEKKMNFYNLINLRKDRKSEKQSIEKVNRKHSKMVKIKSNYIRRYNILKMLKDKIVRLNFFSSSSPALFLEE